MQMHTFSLANFSSSTCGFQGNTGSDVIPHVLGLPDERAWKTSTWRHPGWIQLNNLNWLFSMEKQQFQFINLDWGIARQWWWTLHRKIIYFGDNWRTNSSRSFGARLSALQVKSLWGYGTFVWTAPTLSPLQAPLECLARYNQGWLVG